MSVFKSPGWFLWIAVLVAGVAGIAICLGWFWKDLPLPEPGSPLYEQYVDTFQVGVAALDADVPQVATENLTRAIELVPEEPAAWADRGLLFLWTGQLDEAERDLNEAFRLSPESWEVRKLLGLLAQRRGRFGEAAEHLRVVVENHPRDIETLYLLAQIVDQERKEGSDAEHQHLLEKILAVQPGNLHVRSEHLRLAVRRGDQTAVNESLARFRELAPGWSERTRSLFASLDENLTKARLKDAMPQLLPFSNLLRPEPGYTRNALEVNPPTPISSNSLHTFLRLAPVRHVPADPDIGLTFQPEPFAAVPAGRWDVALPLWLTGEGRPNVFVANSEEIRSLDGKSKLTSIPVTANGVVPLDWNNDFQMDLLIAGSKGLRFYQNQKVDEFVDVTAATGLEAEIRQGDYHGAYAVDFDLEGDLDVLLARTAGPPLLLRNNFDKTFTPQKIFPELEAVRSLAWADFDHDGAPDAAMIDKSGELHIYANERSGQFIKWPAKLADAHNFLATTIADCNDDGVLDLVAMRRDGGIVCLSDRNHREAWDLTELGRWELNLVNKEPGSLRLISADLDNNGVVDLMASGPVGSAAWLGGRGGKFQRLQVELPPGIFAAADLSDSGRLDLIGLDGNGRPLQLRNVGLKNYHWQKIRPRAVIGMQATGDNRINSFGLGGEIELRTGTHVVKQPLSAPVIHFGLGNRSQADVIRLLWPNGTFQVEFRSPVDQTIVAEQRLKGSCPFLFAWNGTGFDFVTDFMWSTPLGMYINANDKGGFLQTTDWVKIGGDQLVPRDGTYELRVNANLWETHYFDHMALIAVDHTEDSELFVDERFFFEPNEPTFHLMERPRPVARAWDHHGRDATDEIRAIDGIHLDRAKRGTYQGVTEDHWVEVELGELSGHQEKHDLNNTVENGPSAKSAPTKDRPLWLVARGWVHPTDSSVNFALEQGKHDKPRGLVLEVPDGNGGWKVARDRLGFPAGKNKTVLVRLDGIDGPGVPRRFRLRTSMEIYWDSIQYAYGKDDSLAVKQILSPAEADLRFRGILAMHQASRGSPELPDYNNVVARSQHWRDLIGFHTRYGDIRELLGKVDDRYAILCGGDEIILKFDEPAKAKMGWKRDFIWVCDGWVKDGDLNTRFGKTVLPLPSHDLKSYDVPPGRLEDDPVYRRHADDWNVYHTRYVTPQVYERGLRNFKIPPVAATEEKP